MRRWGSSKTSWQMEQNKCFEIESSLMNWRLVLPWMISENDIIYKG